MRTRSYERSGMRALFRSKSVQLVTGGALLTLSSILATPAQANSVVSTVPAVGAVLSQAPNAVSVTAATTLLPDGNSLSVTDPNGVQRYIRPHEIEVVFAAEYDPATDRMATIQHLFSAGPVATLSMRLDDGKFVDVELSRKQLEDLGLSVGDEVAIRSNFPQ